VTRRQAAHQPEEAKSSARGLGLEILVGEVADVDKLADIFTEAVRQSNGVAGLASPFFNFNRKRLIDLCSQYRLPSIWEAIAYTRDGGLISYGPSFADMYRRSAGYVAKILKGTKPSELPVQQPIRFELAVNLKTAKTLGVTLPASLIGQADEVVE